MLKRRYFCPLHNKIALCQSFFLQRFGWLISHNTAGIYGKAADECGIQICSGPVGRRSQLCLRRLQEGGWSTQHPALHLQQPDIQSSETRVMVDSRCSAAAGATSTLHIVYIRRTAVSIQYLILL